MPLKIFNPSVPLFTAGSVIFAGSTGELAEDNANFLWDDTNNRLSIGSTENTTVINGGSEGSQLSVHRDGAGDEYQFTTHVHGSTAATGPAMLFARSRGTEASESVVSSGDNVGRLVFAGHDGTDYEILAEIRAEVDGAPGNNDMPGRLVFLTAADGGVVLSERMRIAQNGFVTIGTGGTFSLASGANDLGVNGDIEVEGQARFEGTIGWQTAPATATMWAATFSSATVVNGFDVAITATPGAGTLAATVLDFTLNDIATNSGALTTVTGANFTVRYNRDSANQPTTYNLRAINIANYGIQSGTTVTSGTYNYRGLKVNRNNAGANVSGGTHTFIDFESDSDATGYPGGTRQYAAKFSSDVWIIDSEPFFFGTGEDCDITYDGTNWLFNVNLATTSIVFNEGSVDCDFRVESNNNANGIFLDAGNDKLGVMTNTPVCDLDVNGGAAFDVNAQSNTNYTILTTDHTIAVTTGASNRTITLPSCSTQAGQIYVVKKVDSGAGTVIVTRAGSDTLDGATTKTLTGQWSSIMIQSNESATWLVLATLGTVA